MKRLTSNGAICAVQAREMRRAEKWRQKQQRKAVQNVKKNKA